MRGGGRKGALLRAAAPGGGDPGGGGAGCCDIRGHGLPGPRAEDRQAGLPGVCWSLLSVLTPHSRPAGCDMMSASPGVLTP